MCHSDATDCHRLQVSDRNQLANEVATAQEGQEQFHIENLEPEKIKGWGSSIKNLAKDLDKQTSSVSQDVTARNKQKVNTCQLGAG